MIINVLANHEMYLSILPFEQRLGMTDLPRHGGLLKDNFCLTIMSLLDQRVLEMGNLKFVFLFTQNGPGGIVFSSSNEDEYFFFCSFVRSFFFSYNKILSIMMKIKSGSIFYVGSNFFQFGKDFRKEARIRVDSQHRCAQTVDNIDTSVPEAILV